MQALSYLLISSPGNYCVKCVRTFSPTAGLVADMITKIPFYTLNRNIDAINDKIEMPRRTFEELEASVADLRRWIRNGMVDIHASADEIYAGPQEKAAAVEKFLNQDQGEFLRYDSKYIHILCKYPETIEKMIRIEADLSTYEKFDYSLLERAAHYRCYSAFTILVNHFAGNHIKIEGDEALKTCVSLNNHLPSIRYAIENGIIPGRIEVGDIKNEPSHFSCNFWQSVITDELPLEIFTILSDEGISIGESEETHEGIYIVLGEYFFNFHFPHADGSRKNSNNWHNWIKRIGACLQMFHSLEESFPVFIDRQQVLSDSQKEWFYEKFRNALNEANNPCEQVRIKRVSASIIRPDETGMKENSP